jgi:hypothetical protein
MRHTSASLVQMPTDPASGAHAHNPGECTINFCALREGGCTCGLEASSRSPTRSCGPLSGLWSKRALGGFSVHSNRPISRFQVLRLRQTRSKPKGHVDGQQQRFARGSRNPPRTYTAHRTSAGQHFVPWPHARAAGRLYWPLFTGPSPPPLAHHGPLPCAAHRWGKKLSLFFLTVELQQAGGGLLTKIVGAAAKFVLRASRERTEAQ